MLEFIYRLDIASNQI